MQAKRQTQHDKTSARDVMPTSTCRKSEKAKVVRLAVPGQKTCKQTSNYDFSGIAG
ncbi:MAG: hypothetical protein AB8B48_21870 [Pseudomonadales bacterium]